MQTPPVVGAVAVAVSILVGASAAPASRAQGPWLPDEVIVRLAIQLAERLETVDGPPPLAGTAQERARRGIIRLADAIGARSEEDLAAAAPPPPPSVTLPVVPDTRLKAALRYHICNVVAIHQFQEGGSVEVRAFGAISLTTVTVLQARLLAPHRAAARDMSAVEWAMTGPEMARVLDVLQTNRRVFDEAAAACAAVVNPLADVLMG